MKKLLVLLAVMIAAFLLLAGCRGERYPLPQNAIVFEQGEYLDPNDPEDGYGIITYKGRVYAPYGALNGSVKESDTEGAIGYVSRPDFPEDNAERVIKLMGTDDFLMIYYVNGIMEQPMFFRALDTAGKDIAIPRYIESQGYGIWG